MNYSDIDPKNFVPKIRKIKNLIVLILIKLIKKLKTVIQKTEQNLCLYMRIHITTI